MIQNYWVRPVYLGNNSLIEARLILTIVRLIDMASLSDYAEGVLRMPLSLLTSDGFSECPHRFSSKATVPDFQDFLINQPVTGIVNPETLTHLLTSIGIPRPRFQETLQPDQLPCLNHVASVDCLLGSACLERARSLLGSTFECTVRVFCIQPGQLIHCATSIPSTYKRS